MQIERYCLIVHKNVPQSTRESRSNYWKVWFRGATASTWPYMLIVKLSDDCPSPQMIMTTIDHINVYNAWHNMVIKVGISRMAISEPWVWINGQLQSCCRSHTCTSRRLYLWNWPSDCAWSLFGERLQYYSPLSNCPSWTHPRPTLDPATECPSRPSYICFPPLTSRFREFWPQIYSFWQALDWGLFHLCLFYHPPSST